MEELLLIKIENVHKSYFNCFEDCIASICHYYGKDYMYIFAEKWRVNLYTGNIKELFMELPMFYEPCEILDYFCDLKSDLRIFYRYEYLKEYILDNLSKEIPVIIMVDMFELPWSEFYQKIHEMHFLVVYDYKPEDIFVVSDLTKQIDYMEYDFHKNFNAKVFTITIIPKAEVSVRSMKDYIDHSKYILKSDVEKKGYEAYKQMVELSFADENVIFALYPFQVESEIFVQELLHAGRGRIAFAEGLLHITNKLKDSSYNKLITQLKELGTKWLTFRHRLIKTRLGGKWNQKKADLKEQMMDLLHEDELLYKSFMNHENHENCLEKHSVSIEFLTPYVVDLKPYYNANAFNSHLFHNNQGFDGMGYYFGISEAETDYELNNISLKIHIEKQKDHISCQNQCLKLNCRNVKTVCIIGCCENGDYSDELCFEYEEYSEKVNLIFPDWWERDRFGEKVIKTLDCMKIQKETMEYKKVGEVHIFSQFISLMKGENTVLKEIKLPDLSNMHIFDVVLYS